MKPAYSMSTPGLIVFIIFVAAGIYDFALVLFSGTGSSISAFMVDAGIRSPLWLCVLSMVIGHFVFGMRKTEAVCPKCGHKNTL